MVLFPLSWKKLEIKLLGETLVIKIIIKHDVYFDYCSNIKSFAFDRFEYERAIKSVLLNESHKRPLLRHLH